MSISFSGLASGLDTSSWVESLVALKKAKVETYEEEKSKIQTTQETLSKIKSFFTSFRSMLEKVTDAKFGVGSMDIFAQKLATSSDTSILTAAATTEAEEASYEINVDKLATGTQAVSGFKNMTTVIQSETATMNTKLSAIGVKAGDIGVTVNGTKHTVTIGENDTISNFITKMKNIGVDANYSETSGIFSINLPSGAIDDTLTKHADGTVGTGIVDALHLKSTGGYESSDLKITNSETIVTSATGNTKLSELGTIKSGDIQVKANGTSYTFAINDNTTLANLINNLQSFGVDANLSSDGVLQIRDAEIVDVGNTGIISALGLTSNVNSKSQTSGSLNYETVVTTVTDANGSTKLQELDGWSAVGSDTQIVAKSSSGTTTTINVSGTNTIDEVVTKLNNAGLSASFNTKGVLTVSEGTVSGKVADVLGVTSGSGNTQKIYMSGNILSTKTVTYATAYDTLKDLGISTAKPSSGYALAVYDSKNTLVQEITVNDSMTIDDIFTELSKYGVIGSMSDGVITLNSSNGNFVRGSVAEALGISVFTSVMMTGSVGGNYSITTPIDATCTFAKAGVKASGRSMTVYQYITTHEDGTIASDQLGIINITSNAQTFQELFDALASYGINANLYDGYIQLTSDKGYYVQGDLADVLGIDIVDRYITKGRPVTGYKKLVETIYIGTPTEATKISDYFNIKIPDEAHQSQFTINPYYMGSIVVQTAEGNGGTITLTTDMTFGDLFKELAKYTIKASVTSSCKITFDFSDAAVERFYVYDNDQHIEVSDDSWLNTFGWNINDSFSFHTDSGVVTTTVSKTVGCSVTSSVAASVSNATKLTALGFGTGTIELLRTLDTVEDNLTRNKMTITSSSTVQDFIDWVNNDVEGITATLSHGKLTLSGSDTNAITYMNSILSGSFNIGYGNGKTYNVKNTYTYKSLIGKVENSGEFYHSHSENYIQTGSYTRLFEYGFEGESTISIANTKGELNSITVNENTTFAQLKSMLKEYDIDFQYTENEGSSYSNYDLTIKPDSTSSAWITGITGNLCESLGLETINGFSKTTKSGFANAVSDRFVYVTNGSTEDTSSYQTIYSNKTTGTLMSTGIGAAVDDTQLGAIKKSDGTSITFASEGTAALIIKTTDKDGIVRNNTINFSKTQTLKSVFDTLASYGINASVDGAGMVSTSSTELSDFDISGTLGEFLLGSNYTKKYDTKSEGLKIKDTTTQTVGATRDTLLSDLGVTAGEFYIYNNGVKYTALISSEDTLGSFMDTLKSFGIQAGLIDKGDSSSLVLIGSGNSYVAKSNNVNNASNVVEKLFGTSDVSASYSYTGSELLYSTVTHTTTATTDSLLSDFDTPWGGSTLKSAGDLVVMVNGETKTVRITDTETFGSLVDKLKNAGIQADFLNGKLYVSNAGDLSIIADSTTSSLFNPNANLKMTSKDVLNGFMSSTATIQSTTTIIEEHSASASAYADMNTKLSTLGITSGSLSIYRNGEKALINIEASHTLGDVRSLISQKFSNVDMKFDDNGKLVFYSTDKDVSVELGNTTDTSNFLAVTGVTKTKDGTAESARALYTVNGESKVMADGIFRRGKVTAGSFIIGTERIEINANTTINNLVATINNAEGANATAYWDTIDGKLVIKSRSSGAALINIEAGTSNFTDIMGYTTSEWNADGSLKVSRMNVDTQELGSNAQFRINGTSYTATSNTITSDITRIKGVTLNLNGLTSGSSIKVTVEKDKESVASALSDIVDSYNELMSNVDDAIAKDGALKNQTTLKMIRNQLRSLMTSSDLGATTFRNLSAIGISVEAASASNISTSNSSIINLNFDKEAFFKAYEADADAVKALLIGGKDNKGIFTNVETIVENALQSVSGYFAVTESAYNRELTNLNSKITKSNKEIDRYKSRLEKKFSSMDLTISQMQQQYSSFLS